MTAEDYPSPLELCEIAEWHFARGYAPLLSRMRERWWHPELFRESSPGCYDLSTGGWSGNEELIRALEANRVFWALCWWSSERGGRFVFEVPLNLRSASAPAGNEVSR